jgi:phosphoribosylformylglycinamidine synthase subunit PurL
LLLEHFKTDKRMSPLSAEDKNNLIHYIPEPENLEDIVYALMVNPNLSTINYFNDFSDQQISPESLEDTANDESGIFEIDSTGQFLAMTTHAVHHHLVDDPETATEILVSRAARKMLCFGADPIAVSAFLYHIDFGDHNGHTIASGAKKGLENASRHFNLKVTERKIRFDHFAGHGPVPPTIIITMMGSVTDKAKITSHAFARKGNNIFMIGKSVNDIGASEYLEFYHGINDSPLPAFNIEDEVRIQQVLRVLNDRQLISSANPVGKGGLFFTLLRASFPNDFGFDITTDAEVRKDAFLFGEAMGRIIVDVDQEKEDEFVDTLTSLNVPFFTLGHVTRGEIRIDDVSFGFTDKMSSGF